MQRFNNKPMLYGNWGEYYALHRLPSNDNILDTSVIKLAELCALLLQIKNKKSRTRSFTVGTSNITILLFMGIYYNIINGI